MAYSFREDCAPVVYTRLFGAQNEEEFVEYHERLRIAMVETRSQGRRMVTILDLTEAAPLTARQRTLQSEWSRQTDALFREVSSGIVFVVASAVVRGVLTALFWIRPVPVPHAIVQDLDEAVRWAIARCRETGETVPARLELDGAAAFRDA
jgi:cobalamin biosynthesis protein CobD/CbiB